MATTITIEEWAAEVERLKSQGKEDESWLSRKQLMQQLGISNSRSLQLLHAMNDAGRLLTKQISRPGLGGKVVPHVVYQILPAPKGKKSR